MTTKLTEPQAKILRELAKKPTYYIKRDFGRYWLFTGKPEPTLLNRAIIHRLRKAEYIENHSVFKEQHITQQGLDALKEYEKVRNTK